MRYILIILVFLSVGANAQMVIKAHANYRPFAAPVSANLLLDDYPNAAAAYSLRKLDKDYTGAAIRVRKDTTGQPEQDIGFTASGDLDTAALKSFLNARSGFVTTWYDQSGNSGRNATQSTQANQPRIALNGVIDRQGTRPTVLFDGSNDRMAITTFNASENYSLYYVQKRNSSGVRGVYLAGNTAQGGPSFVHFSDNNIYLQYFRSTQGYYKSVSDNTSTFNLLEGYVNNTPSHRVYKNNSQLTLSGELSFTGTNEWNAIGLYNNGNLPNGTQSEIILYHSDQLSNRSGIATNINTYYGIY
jgi:hypothetical protein